MAFIIAMLPSYAGLYAQETPLLGTWKTSNKKGKQELSETIKLAKTGESLTLITKKDTLVLTPVSTGDSLLLTTQKTDINARSGEVKKTTYTVNMQPGSETMDITVNSEGEAPILLRYAFMVMRCSNHNPRHWATNSAELQKMRGSGCTGITSQP